MFSERAQTRCNVRRSSLSSSSLLPLFADSDQSCNAPHDVCRCLARAASHWQLSKGDFCLLSKQYWACECGRPAVA